MYKMNGWTPSVVLAVIVTIGTLVLLYVNPDSNATPIVTGWVSIIIATFFSNAIVEKEKSKNDKNNDDNTFSK